MTCTCENPETYPIDLGDVCFDCNEFVIKEGEF